MFSEIKTELNKPGLLGGEEITQFKLWPVSSSPSWGFQMATGQTDEKLQRGNKENKAMEWTYSTKKVLGHSRQDGWTERARRESSNK